MKTAIITIAGVSSRFNEGIPEQEKVLKALYSEKGTEDTLLYHLLQKCVYADRIVLVGGYQYEALERFVRSELQAEFPQIVLVRNDHYADLASGYSLYLGIEEAMREQTDEILFVEGDLDIDNASFADVVNAEGSVLTYTTEPIYANKAVVLYQNQDEHYQYAFNSSHGLLRIDEPFSCILNSGQTWKFTNTAKLAEANRAFYESDKGGTNLGIIQRYVDLLLPEKPQLVSLKRWTNCNTREDYRKIQSYWEAES